MRSHNFALASSGLLFLGIVYSAMQSANIPQPAYTNTGNDIAFALFLMVSLWALGYVTGRLHESH